MDNINEIKLTPLQKAKKKYYEKIKNTEKYKTMISSPEYKTKLKESCSKYYNKIKNNERKYQSKRKNIINVKKWSYYWK